MSHAGRDVYAIHVRSRGGANRCQAALALCLPPAQPAPTPADSGQDQQTERRRCRRREHQRESRILFFLEYLDQNPLR